MSHFMKSRTASESGWEIAMLKLKENGFWYHGNETYDTAWESIMLSKFPLDTGEFRENRDVFFGYEIDSKSDDYSWIVEPWDFKIIPLFYLEDNGWGWKTNKPIFTVESWTEDDLVWNMIWDVWWISGKWGFDWITWANLKTLNEVWDNTWNWLSNKWFSLENIIVENFLNLWEKNYLTIYNVGSSNIDYRLITWDGENFTKPVTKVYSSAKIGDIKQNIELEIENSKYFDVLKYSIYDY